MVLYTIDKTGKTLRLSIDGFVNDTSLFTNLPFHQTSMREAIRHLQCAKQTWAQLLEASGGKLELTKCFYYVLNWRFNQDGDPIPTTIAEQEVTQIPKITTQDSEISTFINIQQKECACHHKTLGVYKNILGDGSNQYEGLLKKSDNLAQIVNSAHIELCSNKQ